MAQATQGFSPKADDPSDDSQETALVGGGYCCFWNFPCFNSCGSDKWERISTSDGDQHQEIVDRSWWWKSVKALKKVREWSELVAGPKWKTFIRRFNKTGGRSKQGRFQYDPFSYALNFDEGPGQNGQLEDDRLYRDFSSRFAAIPAKNIPTKDAPLRT